MPIDMDAPDSPGWWAKALAAELMERRNSPKWGRAKYNAPGVRPPLTLLADYLRSEPPLTGVPNGWQERTREFLRSSRMNYAQLVVGSVSDRLTPVGWRTATDSDRDGDQEAAALAEENRLGLVFADAARNMLGLGDGYFIVGPRSGSRTRAVISSEDPRDCITAEDPTSGDTIAGLKLYRDFRRGRDVAKVHLPGKVFTIYAESRASMISPKGLRTPTGSWKYDEEQGGEDGLKTLPGEVCIVRMPNRDGVGEFEGHLAVLDRINDGLFDRVCIAKLQAFRQRAIKNLPKVYPDDHAKAGEEIEYDPDTFAADPGALWDLPGGVDIWESTPVDLGPIRLAIKDDVEGLAAATSTPLYSITPDAANGSAEGASTMREGHIFRTEDRQRRAAYALNRVIELAFAWGGDTERSKRGTVQTIWAPVERYTLQQKASAGSQAKASGMPWATIMTDIWNYRPSELPRLEQERSDDYLFSVTLQAQVAAAAPSAAATGVVDALPGSTGQPAVNEIEGTGAGDRGGQ